MDDAVLSLGGFLYDTVSWGASMEVWTFFCAVPRDKSSEHYTMRMNEDKEALKILGAKAVHFCFLDALDRKDAEFNKLYSTVFAPIHPEDHLVESIGTLIKMELEKGDALMCPLAVGLHVDHVVVRKAAESTGVPLTFFADFPYTEYLPDALEPASAGMQKTAVTVSPDGLSHWIAAMREYKSQNLYPTPDITAQKITEYWAKINGVFLWRKSK